MNHGFLRSSTNINFFFLNGLLIMHIVILTSIIILVVLCLNCFLLETLQSLIITGDSVGIFIYCIGDLNININRLLLKNIESRAIFYRIFQTKTKFFFPLFISNEHPRPYVISVNRLTRRLFIG